MENLEIYESYSNERIVTLKSNRGLDIIVSAQGGRIKSIENQSGIRFPFNVGQGWTRSIETWACNNRFTIDGKSPCEEKKIFGMRAKDIPQGHELRRLFPNKFR